jgi:farnesyl-diphosphate farnesyltransferase
MSSSDESGSGPAENRTDYRPGDARANPRRSNSRGRAGERREGERPRSHEGRPARERSGRGAAAPRGGRRERGRPENGERSRPAHERHPADAAPAEKAAESPATVADAREDLGGELLASVSRSFSLTIRLLPQALRAPISVGYLLARAQDTIADTASVPAAKRLESLRALQEMIKAGRDAELLRPIQKIFGGQKHTGEGDLLKKLDRCLAWLEAQPPADLWDLRRTLARIGYGQELDLLRFGEATDADPKPLATAAELADYTYFVAGCVGELWTRLCERHLPAGWSALPFEEMLPLGKRFGQGLQMVNILRDLPADLAAGRCYLPADLLAQHDLSMDDLLTEPARARPLLETLRQTALEHLDAGWRYVRALKPGKLRYACSLPILIGLETLTLLARQSPLETEERIKMSRASLRGLMASAMIGTAVSPWLTGLHDRLRRRASAKRG